MGLWRSGTALAASRLSPVYRRRLERGWAALRAWCRQFQFPLILALRHHRLIDALLLNFVSQSYALNRPLVIIKHAVLATQWRERSLRKRLPNTWDALWAWEAQLPRGHRRPADERICRYLLLVALERAYSKGSALRARSWILLAVLLLTAFFGMLRPAELYHLSVRDLVFVTIEGQRVLVVLIHSGCYGC